jgi:hypothetical protein
VRGTSGSSPASAQQDRCPLVTVAPTVGFAMDRALLLTCSMPDHQAMFIPNRSNPGRRVTRGEVSAASLDQVSLSSGMCPLRCRC